jgi:hypothetical protein
MGNVIALLNSKRQWQTAAPANSLPETNNLATTGVFPEQSHNPPGLHGINFDAVAHHPITGW